MHRIGIDLGGTKIELLALDAGGAEVFRQRVPTPKAGYGATLEAVAALVREAEAAIGAQGSVGIGIPGALSRATGLVKNANSTYLIGKPFKQDLEARLAREVRVMNDANCFALSEAVDGAGAGAQVVFGPAPRRLAALPLALADGSLSVAGNFMGKVGGAQPG